MKKITILLFSFVLLGAVGCAQQNGANGFGGVDFNTLDRDTSAYLDQDEFCTGLQEQGIFNDWDANNDNTLDAVEFSNQVVEVWDGDGDGAIGQDEWTEFNQAWFEETYDFNTWDTNNDGVITPAEFQDGVQENDLYSDWDLFGDGLDENEFCDMAFSIADENDNDQVSQTEWDTFSGNWF